MSEQPVVEQAEQQPQEGAEQPKTFTPDYVERLRKEAAKYRTEAKQNADAAQRLAEIEEAQKTAEQKAAEREAAATQRAVEAEAKVLRREIAIEHKLTAEDAGLLDTITNEDAMRAIAKRLAPPAEGQQQQPPAFRIDNPGQRPDSEPSKDDLARAFFGL